MRKSSGCLSVENTDTGVRYPLDQFLVIPGQMKIGIFIIISYQLLASAKHNSKDDIHCELDIEKINKTQGEHVPHKSIIINASTTHNPYIDLLSRD